MNQEDLKKRSRGVGRDMSPEAISRRLDIASELYELAKSLGNAKRIGSVENHSGGKDNATGKEDPNNT